MTPPVPPHLLVVDDDPKFREMLQQYLGSHDLRVSTAASSPEMAAILDRDPIDLVLLDLKLQGEDGMQLARRCASVARCR